jgi:hypothetical protein
METTQKSAVEAAEIEHKHQRNCTVELFVRSLAPTGAHPQQEHVIDRIEKLQQEGRIASSSLTVWGNGIAPESMLARTETGHAILETVEEFTNWAARNNLSFPSAFGEREITSLVDERETVIPFPAMCLATREDGELRCVAPCAGEALLHSIHDCLDELIVGEANSDVHDWPSVRSTTE